MLFAIALSLLLIHHYFSKDTIVLKKVGTGMEIMEELEIPVDERSRIAGSGFLDLSLYLKKCRGKPIVRIESGIAFIPKKVYCEKDTAVSDKEQKN